MGNGPNRSDHKIDGLAPDSALMQAQQLQQTSSGIEVASNRGSQVMTRRDLERMRRRESVSEDIRIILNKPFSNVDRITDSLYLTGIGGILEENIRDLKIVCIINCTHEMPIAKMKNVRSLRVPVDDDTDENLFIYLDDVATVIHYVSKRGGRTLVHCMAGASRSCTMILAYLIKYQEYTLKNAFCYLKSLRPCCRPNMAFFEQLIRYETFYRKNNSVKLETIQVKGKTVTCPDFYRTEYPDLFKVEVAKQTHSSQKSPIRLQESNQNYINRNRAYKDIHNDLVNLKNQQSKVTEPNNDKVNKKK